MKFQAGNYYVEIDTSTNPTSFKLVNPVSGLYFNESASECSFSYSDTVANIVDGASTINAARALVETKKLAVANAINDMKQKNEISLINNGTALLTSDELTNKIAQYKAAKQSYEDAKTALAALLED